MVQFLSIFLITLALVFYSVGVWAERILLNLHTLTGQIAIWLMLIHAIWATYTVKRGNEKRRRQFHSYSLIVWTIWLIPYFGGMMMGMSKQT